MLSKTIQGFDCSTAQRWAYGVAMGTVFGPESKVTKKGLMDALRELKDDDLIFLEAAWPDGTTSVLNIREVSIRKGPNRLIADLKFAASDVTLLE